MIILEDFALITNKKYYSVHTELSALSTELEDIQHGQEQPPVAGLGQGGLLCWEAVSGADLWCCWGRLEGALAAPGSLA